jgi:hypothetical protein
MAITTLHSVHGRLPGTSPSAAVVGIHRYNGCDLGLGNSLGRARRFSLFHGPTGLMRLPWTKQGPLIVIDMIVRYQCRAGKIQYIKAQPLSLSNKARRARIIWILQPIKQLRRPVCAASHCDHAHCKCKRGDARVDSDEKNRNKPAHSD